MLGALLADTGNLRERKHVVLKHQASQVVGAERGKDAEGRPCAHFGNGRQHNKRLPFVPCLKTEQFLRVLPDDMANVETDMAAAFRQLKPRLLRQVDFIADAAFRDDDASVGAHFRQPPFYISDHGVFSPCLSGNTRMAYRGPA